MTVDEKFRAELEKKIGIKVLIIAFLAFSLTVTESFLSLKTPNILHIAEVGTGVLTLYCIGSIWLHHILLLNFFLKEKVPYYVDTHTVSINNSLVIYGGAGVDYEIPFSELAMHCKIAGRTDIEHILTNDIVCYILFKDGSTTYGLCGELVPQGLRKIASSIVHQNSLTSETWIDEITDFYKSAEKYRHDTGQCESD